MPVTLPLVILGGSDRRAAALPAAAAGKHALTGYKGVDVRLGGRPMVEVVAERFLASGTFAPVYVAGPEPVYRDLAALRATLIPTDGSFGRNIKVAIERMRAAHPGARFAFTTCDIVPDPADLLRVSERLAAEPTADVWFPLIAVREGAAALGAS
ncbi:MAG TPA: NTP transferase domain-containing protein, partial [Candidatus Polarisedimenticolaceae bacterium]|nr:NTP transferase domain-containing protein [Candidatus Polarisedimenticolaceae bacterium]